MSAAEVRRDAVRDQVWAQLERDFPIMRRAVRKLKRLRDTATGDVIQLCVFAAILEVEYRMRRRYEEAPDDESR